MNLLKSHHLLHQNRHVFFRPNPKITLLFHSYLPKNLSFPSSSTPTHSLSLPNSTFRLSSVSNSHVLHDDTEDLSSELEDLAPDSAVYLNTLRLVECSMFAAVTGLAYFLSNSLSIEVIHSCLTYIKFCEYKNVYDKWVFAELLWMLFRIANCCILYEMGCCSW